MHTIDKQTRLIPNSEINNDSFQNPVSRRL